MKKWLVGILALLIVLIAAVYMLIPSSLVLSHTTSIRSNAPAVIRTVGRSDLWNKLGEGVFILKNPLTNGANIGLAADTSVHGQMLVVSTNSDESTMAWQLTLPSAPNPVKRISGYLSASDLSAKMRSTMEKFRDFCQIDSNVYGIHIIETSTKDTSLLTTVSNYTHVPSTEEVYSNINKIKNYISESGLQQVSPPMLNISTSDSIHYRSMVAVPVNKIDEGKDDIKFVHMVPARFLATEFRGGPATIRQAHIAMLQFFSDDNRMQMAKPFEYMVTDRIAEKDTTKWITRLYYPVYGF